MVVVDLWYFSSFISRHKQLCGLFKYRFSDRKGAVGPYAEILDPPVSICDVTYWLNYLSENNERFKHGTRYIAINTAGEFVVLIYVSLYYSIRECMLMKALVFVI